MDWSQKYITKPPISAEKATKKDFINILDYTNKKLPCDHNRLNNQDDWIASLKNNMEEFIDAIRKDENSIASENQGLFTLVYHNQRLQSERFFENMKRVGQCLRNYDGVRLIDIITDVIEMLSENTGAICKKKMYVPSRKYFKYFIIRLIGCFRLLLKLATFSYRSAYFLTQKIAIGHSFTMATTFLAIMGRIRILSLDMASLIADHFNCILPFHFALELSLSPEDDVEDFPNLTNELQEFCSSCECPNSSNQLERVAEKKIDKIRRILKKRIKKFKEFEVEHNCTKPKIMRRKKKSQKRKVSEIDDVNPINETLKTSTGFFYKDVKRKKLNKRKPKK